MIYQAIGLHVGTAASDDKQLDDGKTEALAKSLNRIQKTAAEVISVPHDTPTNSHAPLVSRTPAVVGRVLFCRLTVSEAGPATHERFTFDNWRSIQ